MQSKGSEPPDSPPPPYYGPHSPAEHVGGYGPQPGGGQVGYYPANSPGAYPNYGLHQQFQAQDPQCQQYPPLSPNTPVNVVMMQPQTTAAVSLTNIETVTNRPQSYLALAMVTCLCFSPLFGLLAICFSAASHSAYEHGDIVAAKRHGTTSLLMCIIGIVLSIVILIIVLTAGVRWKTD